MKRCRDCEQDLPFDDFCRATKSPDGRHTYCRSCQTVRTLAWRRANPERIASYSRKYSLRGLYGITLDEYDAMLEVQNGVCAVCQTACPTGKRLAVDHNHDTGAVRALCCTNCNQAIGHAHDNPELLQKMAEYVAAYA